MTPAPDRRTAIIRESRELFFSQGFSGVTMDEVAGKIGISKKTLYEMFPGKEGLLEEVLALQFSELSGGLNTILAEEKDYRRKLEKVLTLIMELTRKVRPAFAIDLKKNAPHLFAKLMEWREEKLRKVFGGLLEEGMRTGKIRSDLRPELLQLFFQNAVQGLMIPDVLESLPHLTLNDIFETVMKVIFEGILQKGDLIGSGPEIPKVP